MIDFSYFKPCESVIEDIFSAGFCTDSCEEDFLKFSKDLIECLCAFDNLGHLQNGEELTDCSQSDLVAQVDPPHDIPTKITPADHKRF